MRPIGSRFAGAKSGAAQGAATSRPSRPQNSVAAAFLQLQRTAGNAAATAVARDWRAATATSQRRRLSRMLIIAGAVIEKPPTAQAITAALEDLEQPVNVQEVRGVRQRLAAWVNEEKDRRGDAAVRATYTNWSSLTAVASAVLYGLDREEDVDALNRVLPQQPGPVASELLGAVLGDAPVPHSAGTFLEGQAAVQPTEQEWDLSNALFYDPAEVSELASQAREDLALVSLRTMDDRTVQAMSSCHWSAGELEKLLGTEAEEGDEQPPTFPTVSYHQFKGKDASAQVLEDRKRDLQAHVTTLADAISDAAEQGKPRVFRIKYASHSFTAVTTRGTVEVLQSFAGAGGYPLGVGLTKGATWAPAAFRTLLLNAMVPTAGDATSKAERALFGGSVFDEGHAWPNVDLEVRAKVLGDLAEIRRRASERAQSNLAIFKRLRAGELEAEQPRAAAASRPARARKGKAKREDQPEPRVVKSRKAKREDEPEPDVEKPRSKRTKKQAPESSGSSSGKL